MLLFVVCCWLFVVGCCGGVLTSGIRTLGVPELTVNKHLKETQTFSFGAAMAYDHGLQENKDALAGALYRKSNLKLETWKTSRRGVAVF